MYLDRLASRNDVATNAVHRVRLPEGRHLAYTRWGDPAGFPVFYFHGTPSSRLEGVFADPAAKRHAFRLIAVDRPGFGLSDFQRGRRFAHWPNDVMALADHLAVDRFGVAGHSGAGPHLFACGASVDPARLAFIGALGPWGPLATEQIAASLNILDRAFSRLARHVPWAMRAGFAPMGWAARYCPGVFLRILKGAVSPADRAMLADARLAEIFQMMQREAFRQGSRGAAYEASLAYTDWGFDVSSVRVPTHIWLGTEDVFVTPEMGRYLARAIPRVDFHWVTGAGHLNIADWDNIFAACAKSASNPS